ncbi:MAG: thioredoxin, partial [Acidimicrobiia bacterium]|nr:thioredoxin [Acidimicrobiia bacterium]
MESHVFNVDAAAFPQAVLQRSHEVPVVVDFWAEWCGPCKVLGPVLEKLAIEYEGAFKLVKVDVDANQELAAQFGVQGIPNVIGFRQGQPVSRFTGAVPETQVRQWVEDLLPSELDKKVEAARDAALSGDLASAEQLFREVLTVQADHPEAGTGLASLLIARGESEEAIITLGKLPPTPDVDRLQAAARITERQGSDITELEARLEASQDDADARLDLAKALAAKGEYEPSLDHMLRLVREKSILMDDARQGMLDIFDVLGADHPLSQSYRKQLTSALF